MSLIIQAAQFAAKAHAGQFRKYTGRPYIEHPMRVAGRASMLDRATETMVAVAWLHDVIEDCPDFVRPLCDSFGGGIVSGVSHLTNPSKKHPELKRADRKQMDRDHLRECPWSIKVIKFLDRIDNLNEMTGADEKFRRLYFEESLLLAECLCGTDATLVALFDELTGICVPHILGAAQ